MSVSLRVFLCVCVCHCVCLCLSGKSRPPDLFSCSFSDSLLLSASHPFITHIYTHVFQAALGHPLAEIRLFTQAMQNCVRLKSLCINSGFPLNTADENAELLATALTYCGELRILDLSSNGIGDLGAIALASAIEELPKLTRLAMWGNKMGATGCRAMIRSTLNNTKHCAAIVMWSEKPVHTAVSMLWLTCCVSAISLWCPSRFVCAAACLR